MSWSLRPRLLPRSLASTDLVTSPSASDLRGQRSVLTTATASFKKLRRAEVSCEWRDTFFGATATLNCFATLTCGHQPMSWLKGASGLKGQDGTHPRTGTPHPDTSGSRSSHEQGANSQGTNPRTGKAHPRPALLLMWACLGSLSWLFPRFAGCARFLASVHSLPWWHVFFVGFLKTGHTNTPTTDTLATLPECTSTCTLDNSLLVFALATDRDRNELTFPPSAQGKEWFIRRCSKQLLQQQQHWQEQQQQQPQGAPPAQGGPDTVTRDHTPTMEPPHR